MIPNPNFADKTIWTGDNLDVVRGLDCGLRRNDGRAAGADVGNHKV